MQGNSLNASDQSLQTILNTGLKITIHFSDDIFFMKGLSQIRHRSSQKSNINHITNLYDIKFDRVDVIVLIAA